MLRDSQERNHDGTEPEHRRPRENTTKPHRPASIPPPRLPRLPGSPQWSCFLPCHMFAVESTVGLTGGMSCDCSSHLSRLWLGNPGQSTVSTPGIQDQLRGWIRTRQWAGQRKRPLPASGTFLPFLLPHSLNAPRAPPSQVLCDPNRHLPPRAIPGLFPTDLLRSSERVKILTMRSICPVLPKPATQRNTSLHLLEPLLWSMFTRHVTDEETGAEWRSPVSRLDFASASAFAQSL